MDCFDFLKGVDNNSVDLIIIDPPYNILALDWDKQEINWEELSKELFRVLKDFGSVYIFGQTPFIFKVYNDMVKAKFDFRQDLVWVKNRGFSLATSIYTKFHENILYFIKDDREKWIRFGKYVKEQRKKLELSLRKIGELCNQQYYYRGGYQFFETGRKQNVSRAEYEKLKEVLELDDRFDKELFNSHSFNFEDIQLEGEPYKITKEAQKLYGIKSNLGRYTQVNEGKRNPKTILKYSIIQGGNEYTGHPTQKPIKLIRYLIKASSVEKDVVLDCFVGSGTTAVASKQLNRNYLCCDNDKEYFKITKRRLQQEVLLPLIKNVKEDGFPPTPKGVGIQPTIL